MRKNDLWHVVTVLVLTACGVRVESTSQEIVICKRETIGHVIVIGERCHTVRLRRQDGGP